MADLRSSLYEGIVMHHRFRPQKHRFIYRVFSLCLNLDELESLDQQRRLFSLNRFNLFSFHEKDHGRGTGKLRNQITEILVERGYDSATAHIRLLCYPRILGYTFNPLSVYFCYNRDAELEVILYEVSNTFGQRHTYLLTAEQDKTGHVRQQCDKQMYVSPFMPMNTGYSFRILPPAQQVAVNIRQTERDSGKAVLHATFSGKHSSLTDSGLLKAFIKYPLMTLKVMTAIHWEALRLWRKNVKIQPRTPGKHYSISWQDKHGVIHHESH